MESDHDFRNDIVRELHELSHTVFPHSVLFKVVVREAAPEACRGDGIPKGAHGWVVIRARRLQHGHKLPETSAAVARRGYRSQKFHDFPVAAARQSEPRHAPL